MPLRTFFIAPKTSRAHFEFTDHYDESYDDTLITEESLKEALAEQGKKDGFKVVRASLVFGSITVIPVVEIEFGRKTPVELKTLAKLDQYYSVRIKFPGDGRYAKLRL
ncbi:MAG TPA: hypothetical protein VIN59_07205 [Alphaproteobacteria bacterium]